MPPKKVAKKAAKKAAKHPSQDIRRAYEHLGRVDILEGALAGTHFVHVSALANLAQQSLAAGYARDAADLLRAAEHICFAALAPEDRAGPVAVVSASLRAAIATELHHLLQHAEDHWSQSESTPSETLTAIYTAAHEMAQAAFKKNAFRPALELARAAEALSHIVGRPHAAVLDSKLRSRLAS
jgi:peptidoglycan/xylan/chitin deacetylase (PgdA/CDA1 family)